MNVVPTPRTRAIARRMIVVAKEETAADAIVKLLPKLERDQLPALLGVLLTNTRLQAKMGRPMSPLLFSPEERKEGNRRYKRGDRSEWTLARWREYQRVNRRTHMARTRPRPPWAPMPVDTAYRSSAGAERLTLDTTRVGPGGVAAPSPGLADRMDTTD